MDIIIDQKSNIIFDTYEVILQPDGININFDTINTIESKGFIFNNHKNVNIYIKNLIIDIQSQNINLFTFSNIENLSIKVNNIEGKSSIIIENSGNVNIIDCNIMHLFANENILNAKVDIIGINSFDKKYSDSTIEQLFLTDNKMNKEKDKCLIKIDNCKSIKITNSTIDSLLVPISNKFIGMENCIFNNIYQMIEFITGKK
jgi:hypothetical protein